MTFIRSIFVGLSLLVLGSNFSFSQTSSFVGKWDLVRYNAKTDLRKSNFNYRKIQKENIIWSMEFTEDSVTEILDNLYDSINQKKSGVWELKGNRIVFKFSQTEILSFYYSISNTTLILRQEEILTGGTLKAVFKKN